MKKFTLLLSAMLLALATNLWAQEVSFTIGNTSKGADWGATTATTFTDKAGTSWSRTISPTSSSNHTDNNDGGSQAIVIGSASNAGSATFTGVVNKAITIKTISFKTCNNNKDKSLDVTITLGDFTHTTTVSVNTAQTTSETPNVTLNANDKITIEVKAQAGIRVYAISYTYEAASTEPTLTAEPKEINLSAAFDAETGAEGETTVKISGKNLVEGGKIILSLNDDESSDCTWDFVAPASKEIEVTNATVEQDVTISYYAINAGTYTATLTITATDATSADIATVSIPVSLNVVAPYTISWSVNGTITNTTLIPGATLKDIMPATAEVPSACSDKAFVGWCTTSTVAENGEGIVYVNENTVPEGDATYYAVFAKGSQVEGEKTIEFVVKDYATANNWSNDTQYTSAEKDELTITYAGGGNDGKYYTSNNSWRVYSNGTVTLKVSEGEIQSVTAQPTKEFTIADDKKSASFKATAKTEFTSFSVKIKTLVGNYSEYATTCSGTGTEIENVVAPAAIRKMIENGQLVIIIDGVKYNAQGVVIR